MIRVVAFGQVLEVVAPFYPPFADRARGMMGRCQNGVWRFSLLREAEVRAALWEFYGTDGTPVPTVAVEITVSPTDADEASVWGLGRRLVRRAKHDNAVLVGAGVRIVSDFAFPLVGGTPERPALGYTSPVVLEVRQVPEELARRMAEKEPERYRVIVGDSKAVRHG